jgi:hypothetical protein
LVAPVVTSAVARTDARGSLLRRISAVSNAASGIHYGQLVNSGVPRPEEWLLWSAAKKSGPFGDLRP